MQLLANQIFMRSSPRTQHRSTSNMHSDIKD